jgi:hypothetical protein
LGRGEVHWIHVALRVPDDGTGALPLLRHVILNDDKSSTYKLALLRALCRVADGAAGFSRDHDDEFVSVPLGLSRLPGCVCSSRFWQRASPRALPTSAMTDWVL